MHNVKCQICKKNIAHYVSDWFGMSVCYNCISYDTFRDNDDFTVAIYVDCIQLFNNENELMFCDFDFIHNEFSRYNGHDDFVKKHYKEKYREIVMRLSASYIGI
jgi:hypothetical protein